MKRLVMAALATITLSGTATASMGLFDTVGASMVLHMTQFLEPKDIGPLIETCKTVKSLEAQIKVKQLPKLYKKIGQDYSRAFFDFKFTSWKLQDAMPFKIKTLVHDWFLKGYKNKDPVVRLCCMLAAGRAGHRLAAEEAGRMLMDSVTCLEDKEAYPELADKAVLPCMISLDDLIRNVPGIKEEEAWRWDVMSLQEEIILDPDLQKLSGEYWEEYPTDMNYFQPLFKGICTNKKVCDQYDQLIKGIIDIETKYAELAGKSEKAATPEYRLFIAVRKLKVTRIDQPYLGPIRKHFEPLVSSPLEEDATPEEREFHANGVKYLGALLEHIQTKIKKNTMEVQAEWTRPQLEFMGIPLQESFFAVYYEAMGDHENMFKAEKRLLTLVSNSLVASNVLYSFYKTKVPESINDPAQLRALMKEVVELSLLTNLLGEMFFWEKLYQWDGPSYLERIRSRLVNLHEQEPSEREAVYKEYNEALPIQAFMYQLALLRQPYYSNTLLVAAGFYGQKVLCLENENDASESPLNLQRNLGLNNIYVERERDGEL